MKSCLGFILQHLGDACCKHGWTLTSVMFLYEALGHAYCSCIMSCYACEHACWLMYTCRRKPTTNQSLSDRELFQQLPLGDPWPDADLYTVFHYLWTSSALVVPESWKSCMAAFEVELRHACVADSNLVDEYNSIVNQAAQRR